MPCFSPLECERESVITSAISKYIQDLTKLFLPLLTVKPLSNRTYKLATPNMAWKYSGRVRA